MGGVGGSVESGEGRGTELQEHPSMFRSRKTTCNAAPAKSTLKYLSSANNLH